MTNRSQPNSEDRSEPLPICPPGKPPVYSKPEKNTELNGPDDRSLIETYRIETTPDSEGSESE